MSLKEQIEQLDKEYILTSSPALQKIYFNEKNFSLRPIYENNNNNNNNKIQFLKQQLDLTLKGVPLNILDLKEEINTKIVTLQQYQSNPDNNQEIKNASLIIRVRLNAILKMLNLTYTT
jgi:hypothetical protein